MSSPRFQLALSRFTKVFMIAATVAMVGGLAAAGTFLMVLQRRPPGDRDFPKPMLLRFPPEARMAGAEFLASGSPGLRKVKIEKEDGTDFWLIGGRGKTGDERFQNRQAAIETIDDWWSTVEHKLVTSEGTGPSLEENPIIFWYKQ